MKKIPKYLTHYTTINTLELILKNKTIKFNRLDLVDDLMESKTLIDEAYSKYCFISCWTKSDSENLALWKFYSEDFKGVCLKLPFMPFIGSDDKGNKMSFENYRKLYPSGEHVSFHLEGYDVFPDNYVLQYYHPSDQNGIDGLFTEITYKKDYSIKKINPIVDENKRVHFLHDTFGRIKDIDWKFQNEFRYILHIYLRDHLDGIDELNYKEIERMYKNNPVDIEKIYISLSELALSKGTIIIGPKCDDYEREEINKIKNSYCPVMNVIDSKWKSYLR